MLESNSKLYYSIKEVSETTKLKPYVLRYWESEFPSLKPTKNKAGNRTCLLYTSPSPRDGLLSRMPSSA